MKTLPAIKLNNIRASRISGSKSPGGNLKFLLAASIVAHCVLFASPSARGQVLLNYDFESLTNNSNLSGQGGWNTGGGAGGVSPQVLTSPTTTNYTGSQSAATSSNSTGASWGRNTFFSAGTFNATTTPIVRIEFDVYRTGSVFANVGIGGNDSSQVPLTAGINGANFELRLTNYGTQNNVSGAAVTANNWYRIRAEWDLVNGTGTMFAKNLTDPTATGWQSNTTAAADGFRQLYFGPSLTNPSITLSIPSSGVNALPNWDTLYLRTAITGTGLASYTDNIVITAIPEPSTMALGVLALGITAAVFARRRRSLRDD